MTRGIDPVTSLASSIAAAPGRYALLLGSGVSRAAAIPTGWEVIERLVMRLAAASGDDPPADPAAWYRDRFDHEPSYAELLDVVASTRDERAQLLRTFFEPTVEEREQGLKGPTAAHRAIARLVRDRFIRVVMTTNFDRLLEDALRDEGVAASVLTNADAVMGAAPLVHNDPIVLKLHGDYLDTRIRNTPEELEKYEPAVDGLLDQIFDEFGLIVCGWSGEWDTALRAAMERCPSRRYTTYWATTGEPTLAAEALIALRQAQPIRIEGADAFFDAIVQKVQAISDLNTPDPMTARVAAETVKRFIGTSDEIRLHDAVTREAERVWESISSRDFPVDGQATGEELATRFDRFDGITTVLRGMLGVGCYWAPDGWGPWVKALERIANPDVPVGGNTALIKSRLYPAMECLYVAGVAALAHGRHGTVLSVLVDPLVVEPNGRLPLVSALESSSITWIEMGKALPDMQGRRTPMSERLQAIVREDLRGLLPNEAGFLDCFDMFEYILGVTYLAMERGQSRWAPWGSFTWRHQYDPAGSPGVRLQADLDKLREEHPLIVAGWFDGSLDRVFEGKAAYDTLIAEVARRQSFS